jgi:diguanylate cyclase (GGDEF)-like protein/PAS domain S-box-containing protein
VTEADEGRLREAEERFRLAFDNAPIGMALVSPDGRFLQVNASLCDLVGYPADELVMKSFQDITHPDDLDADLDSVGRMLAGAIRTYSTEKRYFHADGHVVWINLSVSLVRGEDEVPLYFISQIEDITERKRTEEALRESEALFRLLADNASDLITLINPDGVIVYASPSARVVLGYEPEELVGRSFYDFLDTAETDPAVVQAAHQQVLAQDEPGPAVVLSALRKKDGTTVVVEATSQAVTDAQTGEVVEIRAAARDVTKRVRAERALRQSEQSFRLLIETSTEAFIAMNGEGLITEWNRQAEATFGWSLDEAVGRRVAETIIPPALREAHEAGLARYLATGEGPVLGRRLELEGRHRDGHEFPVELAIWAVGAGPDVSFNALLHDISERRRAEQELWELALVDELTGLHNRRSFILLAEQAIKEAVRAKRPVIALFVDVDHLKAINDTHGHSEGDRALRLVADALRAACRESDIVGRLSGDEFAILLAEAHQQDGLEQRVRRQVDEVAEAFGYPLSVSIGTATCGAEQPCELPDLFARADRAMYEEKAAKRQAEPETEP